MSIPKAMQGGKIFSKKFASLNRKAVCKEKVVDINEYRQMTKRLESKTILIVDDESSVRNAIRRIFERDNYKVLFANDGINLSKLIETTHFDIVLLDVNLPWVNGYDLCRLLKGHPFLRNIPVAMVSGNKTEDDIRQGYEAGCDEYITKPFEVDEIQRIVSHLLLSSAS